jgi:hypothetical protein
MWKRGVENTRAVTAEIKQKGGIRLEEEWRKENFFKN